MTNCYCSFHCTGAVASGMLLSSYNNTSSNDVNTVSICQHISHVALTHDGPHLVADDAEHVTVTSIALAKKHGNDAISSRDQQD